MADAIGGSRPTRGWTCRGHHVDEDPERRRQIDAARAGATFLERDIVDQHEAKALDPLRHIAGRRRRDRARDQLAVAVERAITIVWHQRPIRFRGIARIGDGGAPLACWKEGCERGL
jgi:hypothetical protein